MIIYANSKLLYLIELLEMVSLAGLLIGYLAFRALDQKPLGSVAKLAIPIATGALLISLAKPKYPLLSLIRKFL